MRAVSVFFYGSFIDPGVLQERGYAARGVETARLAGFDIRFAPLATLVPAEATTCVYGIVCEATHDELRRLYGESWVASYLPEAVVVETTAGRRLPALVYIAWGPTPPAPFANYLDHIIEAGRQHGFPSSYLEHLRIRWEGRAP